MTSKKSSRNTFLCASTCLCVLFIISCAKLTPIKSVEEPSLGKVYKKIIIQKFEVDQDLEKDLPDATVICESTAMNELLKINVVPKIEKARLSTSREATALIVKTRITTLRLASNSPRGLSGTFVGNSEMAANVKLIDAEKRKTLHEKNISTVASSDINSDSSMPHELGKMIAEYIVKAIQSN